MKKGFTLIELLAVVIILAVVALIATPIMVDVIDDARSSANKDSAYGIVKAGEYFYAESLLDDSKKPYINGESNIYDQITVTGEKPETGELYVNSKGQVAMSVTIGDNCYVKDFYGEIEELDSGDENCELGYVGEDTVAPIVTLTIKGEVSSTGWYTKSPYIHISVSDLESGIQNYKWCQGIDCDAENSENIETSLEKDVLILDNIETQVCVIAYDKAGNESGKVCSEIIQVDTTEPEINGVMADSNIPLNEEIDLITGVEVSDATSGIYGTFKILNENNEEITELDTTKSGIYKVKYVVSDIAGNETTTTVTIEVSGSAPTITYSVEEGIINENGWAKEDFIVTINITDNSGHGIESFNVCTATTDTCDSSKGSTISGTTGVREIVTEDSNNRICVEVTDKSGKTSTLCSSAYKLDKTAPVVGTIKVNGSNEIKDWYTEDVTIEVVEGFDSLSGHDSTTSNVTSITENTNGTIVTITTTDKAGNTSSKDYTIKVDKTLPTCTFTTLNYVGLDKTATIELTCTNSISKMSDTTLSTSDFIVNNAEITGVSKTAVTNGYKYTITVKGIKTGASTITLPTSKVTTVAGLGNEEVTSGNITITSVSLNPTSGTLYVGGSNLTSSITTSNAGSLSCTSSNTSIATCSVSDFTLIVLPGNTAGDATITVTGENGNPTVIYTVTVKEVSLTLNPTSATLYENGNNVTATISGENYGELSCESSDETKATCLISGTTLTVTPKAAGNVTITVSETNGNATVTYTTTVIKPSLTLSPTSGTLYENGNNVTATIIGENHGELSCESSDETKATCLISGTTLTITPVSAGTSTITVSEANGNVTATYTATVIKPTLTLNEYEGTIYNGGSNKTLTVGGENYGELTCKSNNESYATCSMSGNTLTIKPGNVEGTATITVTESNAEIKVEYKATNKIPTISLSPTSGTTYVGGNKLTSTITTNESAGKLSCTPGNSNIATCSISGNTLTMTPGSTVGSTTIIVKEENGNKTASYTFNNIDDEFKIDVDFVDINNVLTTIDGKKWASDDFYIRAEVTDTENRGLTKLMLCTDTDNDLTCDPANEGSQITSLTCPTGSSADYCALRELTSTYNVICVQATDEIGRTSSPICSELYSIDKSTPATPTITASDSITTGNWHKDNFTLTFSGSSSISGITYSYGTSSSSMPNIGTSVSITSNTSSTTYYVKACNGVGTCSSTVSYVVKLDTTTPTVTITKASDSTKLTATVTPTTTTSNYIYQWYKGSSVISGETSTTYTPTTAGTYKVVVTTGAGKTTTSNEITIQSYTITYNMNGGSATIANQTKVEDISLTLSSTTPTKTGYTFKGWSTSSTATSETYKSGGTYTANASAILYAVYSVNSYTCSGGYYLSANATSCTKCEAGSYCAGGTYNYSSSTQGKSSCPSGYGTSAAGSDASNDCYLTTTAGKYIATANSSTQTTCTANYYCPATTVKYGSTGGRTSCPSGYGTSAAGSDAANDCYKTITATFNANGATLSKTSASCSAYYNNSSCSVTAPTITRDGYEIIGFNTSSSATTSQVNSGATFSISTNTTYYAITIEETSKTKVMLAAGMWHSLAIDSAGKLWAFGDNSFGQFGNGTKTDNTNITTTPVQVKSGTTFKAVAAGSYHSLAIDTSGNLWAWGYNEYGQLGNGTASYTSVTSPVQIKSGTTFKAVAAGAYHSLAIDTSGNLWAWGNNSYGQLGNGTETNTTSPVQIKSGTTFKTIAASGSHSLAIDTSGNLWVWGLGESGQLGNGSNISTSPVQIKSGTKFKDVSANSLSSYAIDSDNNLWGWGSGLIGNGTTTGSSSPVQISSDTKFDMVATGLDARHALAIDTSGNLWGWGYTSSGQLSGIYPYENAEYPVQITSNVVSVAAAENYTVAIVGTDLQITGDFESTNYSFSTVKSNFYSE